MLEKFTNFKDFYKKKLKNIELGGSHLTKLH